MVISANKINKILESFLLGDISRFSQEFYIYSNPDSSDIAEMVKTARDEQRQLTGIRVVADAKKQIVYVTDAFLVDHNDIRKSVKLPNNVPWIVDGLATYESGKFVFKSVFNLDGRINQEIQKYNWSFVSRYVKNFPSKLG